MPPKTVIIILNWNGWRDTVDCLDSVLSIDYPNYDLIIVDNGSKDDSVARISQYVEDRLVASSSTQQDEKRKQKAFYKYVYGQMEPQPQSSEEINESNQIILIVNERNLGFTGGNNLAFKYAMEHLAPQYLLMLNNDTIVDEASLSEMVGTAQSDSAVGIVGPKIYYYDFNGRKDVISFAGEDLVDRKSVV